jgi:hypothetical protein
VGQGGNGQTGGCTPDRGVKVCGEESVVLFHRRRISPTNGRQNLNPAAAAAAATPAACCCCCPQPSNVRVRSFEPLPDLVRNVLAAADKRPDDSGLVDALSDLELAPGGLGGV